MKRVPVPELLDSDAGTPAEVQATLADLRMVNRWFGGASTMCRLVERVADETRRRQLSWLDIGGATGDIPEFVEQRLARRRIRLDAVVLDRALSHMGRRLPAVAANAMQLPFAENSFDLVGSSLFVHHFEPGEVVRLINESLRVCRQAVLINDLRRSHVHLALVFAGFPLYRSRLTRNDGPASIRRAYTLEELRRMLQQTAASRIDLSTHYLYRMGAIVWKLRA